MGMLSRILIYVLSGLVLAMAALHVSGAGPRVDVVLPPQSIEHEEGQRYRAPLPIGRVLAALVAYDSMLDFGASRASLKEDGVAIGRAHSDHAGIARDGGGRFSHWGHPLGQRVFLSSSDGSDPRSNGRFYALELQVLPPVWLLVLAGALLAWLGTRAAASWIVPAAVLASIGLGSAWISIFWGAVLISPDSATYITFHPWVPLGYPAFVAAIAGTLGYLALPAVQVVALLAAGLFLAFATGSLTGSRPVTAFTAVAVTGYAPLMYRAGYILADALYAALLLAFAACGILLLKRFRPAPAVAFGILAALAWAVRPSGMILFLVVAYLSILLLRQARFRSVLAWLIVPTVAAVVLLLAITNVVRGPGFPSQAGRVLFGQVAFLFDPARVAPEDRPIAEGIAEALAPHRAGLDAQSGWMARHAFASADYPQRLVDVDLVLNRQGSRDFRANEALLMRLARDTIGQNFSAYLAWVAEDVAWVWRTKVLYMTRSASHIELAIYGQQAATRLARIERSDLPLTVEQVSIDERAATGPGAEVVNLIGRCLALIFTIPGLVPLLGALLLVAALAAPFVSSPLIRAVGLIGAIVHLSVAMTSAVTLFIERYALHTDPLVIVGLILMIHGVLEWSCQRRAAAGGRPRRS